MPVRFSRVWCTRFEIFLNIARFIASTLKKILDVWACQEAVIENSNSDHSV
jgi:hypothetical protein